MAADPFEVRVKFSNQLQHLNASVNSAQKAALYAIKYRDMDEDLHSCILEQLERNNMNNRANIMYFIEHLCDVAQREGHLEFVNMIQRDIIKIVDAVAPADGSGAANVKIVRKVLNGLQAKQVLEPTTINELEDSLKERDTASAHPVLSPTEVEMGNKPGSPQGTKANGVTRLDKRQVEQRIEEDRERHKRLRESIWAVPTDENAEFDKMWDEASDMGEDDYLAGEEDAVERRVGVVEIV